MLSRRTINTSASIISPPPRLTISEWADKYAYLPQEENAEPGKYRLSRMPHQAAMLDDPLDPTVREIYWMLASQVGKTLCLILICEFIIHQLHKSIVFVRATLETAKTWMRDKFIPTVRDTKCMDGLLKEPRARDSESTALSRKFPGGSLKALGAKSPPAFRGASAPNIFQDEIDTYETIKEGDPLALADRAAITFTDSWKIKASTPTLEGFSRIAEGFKRGDQQRYFVPCPRCGHFQFLEFERVKFTFNHEESVYADHPNNRTWELAASGSFPIRDTRRAIYVCSNCKRGWTDQQRIASILSGHPDNPAVVVDGHGLRAHWVATAPFSGIRSRHLSGMYLTIGLEKGFETYLHQFAEKFLAAKSAGRESLMVWTNLFLCETFEDAHERVAWEEIQARAEDYDCNEQLPVEVMFIIGGADVHPDRVEIATYGWGAKQEVWAVEYQIIYGDFDMPEMQQRVEEYLLNRRWRHPVLGEMDIRACGIDSGHQTKVKAVYHFCKKHSMRNFWAVKGFDEPLGSIFTAAQEKRFSITRFNLNVGHIKSYLYDRLKNAEPGANCIHFPKLFGAKFYQQLCSERRFPEPQKNGGVVYRWRKPTSSTRNEALDTAVYAFGVYEIVKQGGAIERKWQEVLKILQERSKAEPIQPQQTESKLPELAVTRTHFKPPRPSGWIGAKGKWL